MGIVPFGQLPLLCQVWDNTCRDDSFLTLMEVSNGKLLLGFICKLPEALYYIVSMHASLVKYWGQAEK